MSGIAKKRRESTGVGGERMHVVGVLSCGTHRGQLQTNSIGLETAFASASIPRQPRRRPDIFGGCDRCPPDEHCYNICERAGDTVPQRKGCEWPDLGGGGGGDLPVRTGRREVPRRQDFDFDFCYSTGTSRSIRSQLGTLTSPGLRELTKGESSEH